MANIAALDRDIVLTMARLAGAIAAPTRLDPSRMGMVAQEDADEAPWAMRSKAPPVPRPQSEFTLADGEVTGFARMMPRERSKGGATKRTNGCSTAYRAHESRAVFSRG